MTSISGYISLVCFSVLMFIIGYILVAAGLIDTASVDLAIIISVFAVISLSTLIIFSRGQKKDPESQTMHSLVAISVKFLLEILFAVIWFIPAKKTGHHLILLFFVLYLTFTGYSVFIILKTLKTKSFDNNF